MSIQLHFRTEFLSCSICCQKFDLTQRPPISLRCGHTICRTCLIAFHNKQCPFDQISNTTDFKHLPINYALLHLVNENTGNIAYYFGRLVVESEAETENLPIIQTLSKNDLECYKLAKKCIENLALYLKTFVNNGCYGSLLSRSMQRKLFILFNCQLMEDGGKARALRIARSLGERSVTEFILLCQNAEQLSSNLWAAVRLRGCQFLGPAVQEEVLKLILLALEDGSALSRKVLIMFVVQRIELVFPLVSKTSIGHVIQLLYRASCFKVFKCEEDSSVMQLKEDYRTYQTLRREHDSLIVQIATDSGIRITPEQWSLLLYGDNLHKSHMQSVIDKMQAVKSFSQSIKELTNALQRIGEASIASSLRVYLKHLLCMNSRMEHTNSDWPKVVSALDAVKQIMIGLLQLKKEQTMQKVEKNSLKHGSFIIYKNNLQTHVE